MNGGRPEPFRGFVAAFAGCDCILTETKKKASNGYLAARGADEHLRGGFALEEERGEYQRASRLAKLKSRQRRGDTRSEKKTGAMQVGQAHTLGWSAGHNSLKRVGTGVGAECFSLAEENPYPVRTTRTAEKTRRRLQSGD